MIGGVHIKVVQQWLWKQTHSLSAPEGILYVVLNLTRAGMREIGAEMWNSDLTMSQSLIRSERLSSVSKQKRSKTWRRWTKENQEKKDKNLQVLAAGSPWGLEEPYSCRPSLAGCWSRCICKERQSGKAAGWARREGNEEREGEREGETSTIPTAFYHSHWSWHMCIDPSRPSARVR